MPKFIAEYFIFVVVAGIGVVQIAASIGQLKGLLFFKSNLLARTLGALLVLGVSVWFFASDDRNISDMKGGIDANGQALYFFLGVMTTVVTTLVVSSLVNLRMSGADNPGHKPLAGFEALKTTNYLSALWRSLRYWSKEWRAQTKSYFFG